MSDPISPPPLTTALPGRLRAHLGNGQIGLRVGRIPFTDGLAVVNGFWGRHPKDGGSAVAIAPYPFTADIALGDRWASDVPGSIRLVSQGLDMSCGELCTSVRLELDGASATVDVVDLCSRTDPALALQEIRVRVDRPTLVRIRSSICTDGAPGRWLGADEIPRGRPPTADAWLTFEGMGGAATCGAAITVAADDAATGRRVEIDEGRGLVSVIAETPAEPGRAVRQRSIVGLVPDLAHTRPAHLAAILVGRGIARGWDDLRTANREAWRELWRARPVLDAPGDWQARSDASFFYLHSAVSRASLASTGVFGLAYGPGYHFYRGHVMWDVESFAFPPLVMTDPDAARAILRFRSRSAEAARANAALHGFAGLMFPWEAEPVRGEEAVPRWSKTDKDHINLDVGLAFSLYAAISGDRAFARNDALPVVDGVAEWLLSRLEWTDRGAEIRRARGPAEAFAPIDNDAFVNLSAITFLRRAAELLRWLGEDPPEAWEAIARQLVIPTDPRTGAIVNHDDYLPDEPLGETPEAAAAIFPVGYRGRPDVERATLRYALKHQVPRFVGTPMLSAALGVYAAWEGRRGLAADLLDRGYAAFFDDPFWAPDEYPAADERFPPASPMLANLGAFLGSVLTGFPGILPSLADPRTWPERPVVLPAGWRSIEVERLWVRGRPARLLARHGAAAATLELGEPPWAAGESRVRSIGSRVRPAVEAPAANVAPARGTSSGSA
ncbi:MAG TPA: hypothetical protein VFI34_00425 [Candidatus Limnocylindrales bacterium]|nr:hypothetical protein [Candidatus Limnocylindrales bacterium]